jgi:hypothetical protein
MNKQWKNHKYLQTSLLLFAPPSSLQDFSSNITLLQHPLLCPVKWLTRCLPHFQSVQVATILKNLILFSVIFLGGKVATGFS